MGENHNDFAPDPAEAQKTQRIGVYFPLFACILRL
jgi:hypothetical protein